MRAVRWRGCAAGVLMLAVGCGQATSSVQPTVGSTVAPTVAAAPSSVTLTLAADGNEARFRAREQLADRPAPSDAIGHTSDVSGALAIGPSGIAREGSKVSVAMDSLATDSRLRDRFIKTNTLHTAQYPTAEFVPASISGLAWPLPTSGDSNFQLIGELTIHGTTQPATWDVKAQFSPQDVVGTASTTLTLDRFGMQKPRVGAVLSIEDTITLELDFHAIR